MDIAPHVSLKPVHIDEKTEKVLGKKIESIITRRGKKISRKADVVAVTRPGTTYSNMFEKMYYLNGSDSQVATYEIREHQGDVPREWIDKQTAYILKLSGDDRVRLSGYTFGGDRIINTFLVTKTIDVSKLIKNKTTLDRNKFMVDYTKSFIFSLSIELFDNIKSFVDLQVCSSDYFDSFVDSNMLPFTKLFNTIKAGGNIYDTYLQLVTYLSTHGHLIKQSKWIALITTYIENLTRIIDKSPTSQVGFYVYRGISEDKHVKINSNYNTYVNNTFMSTSLSLHTTSTFINSSGKCCVLTLQVLPGIKCLFLTTISQFPFELEVGFAPGTVMYLHDINTVEIDSRKNPKNYNFTIISTDQRYLTTYAQPTEADIPKRDAYETVFMKYIEKTEGYFNLEGCHHLGDLTQHSIWTARALDKWFRGEFDDGDEWIENIVAKIPQHLYKYVTLLGLIHDLGKIDGDKTPTSKFNHPQNGYKLALEGFANELSMDQRIQKDTSLNQKQIIYHIAIISVLHQKLGDVLQHLISVDTYVNEFTKACEKAPVYIDKKQLLLILLVVSLADVKGAWNVEEQDVVPISSFVWDDKWSGEKPIVPDRCKDKGAPWIKYGYNEASYTKYINPIEHALMF